MMIPIVWPKGSLWRQLLVFICFIILVSGRVVNLFVPEYTKLIGKLISVKVFPSSGMRKRYVKVFPQNG